LTILSFYKETKKARPRIIGQRGEFKGNTAVP